MLILAQTFKTPLIGIKHNQVNIHGTLIRFVYFNIRSVSYKVYNFKRW